jgi:hypothetical protein
MILKMRRLYLFQTMSRHPPILQDEFLLNLLSAEDEETLNIPDNIQSNFEAKEEHLIEDENDGKDPDFVPPSSACSIQASRKKGDRVAGTKPRKEVPLTKLDLANSLESLTSRCAK